MMCLSVMQIFKTIGNHLHIGNNKKNMLGFVVFITEVTTVKHAFVDPFHCKLVESTLPYLN